MQKQRKCEENIFITSDDIELFYRHWPASNKKNDKAFVIFHRGHEHSGRLQHIVDELEMPEAPMFAWDARGHGKTVGPRGYSPSVGTSVRDIDEFIKYISKTNNIPTENIIIIAQSISAVQIAAWVHDYAPKIRGLILGSPAFKVKLYVPFANEAIALWQKILGKTFYVSSYVKAKFLTHDSKRIESFNNDTLISKAIASNILLGLRDLGKRIVSDARAIKIPTQMFISGSDFVVHHKPQHEFYKNLGSSIKEKHVIPGFYHDTFGEKDRKQVFDKMREFINFLYSAPYTICDYKYEDKWSATADEFRTLQAPLPIFSLKGVFFRTYKLSIYTLGRLSAGIALGIKTGFNSGSTLDYVYKNKASGKFGLGILLDKVYLSSPGWVGIRQRKINLENFIKESITTLNNKGMPVHVLDIAAGHGRYVLDVIKDIKDVESVLLCDYSEINVEKGNILIEDKKLEKKVKFIKNDAFDKNGLKEVKATLAIVSGLYELFPTNNDLNKSLGILASKLEKGGILIYTNQPWHPQLELIARTLTDFSNKDKPWIMRARTQGEIDYLVENADFIKQHEVIDEWGMFSVSIAERI